MRPALPVLERRRMPGGYFKAMLGSATVAPPMRWAPGLARRGGIGKCLRGELAAGVGGISATSIKRESYSADERIAPVIGRRDQRLAPSLPSPL